MKTYVLMISRVFPAYHPRAGEKTFFRTKIKAGFGFLPTDVSEMPHNGVLHLVENPKIHTIRENYDLWARRSEEINAGRAVLSLREWTGSPYNFKRDGSKQREFLRLEKIGVQRFWFDKHGLFIDDRDSDVMIDTLAQNDGLSTSDFRAWFKNLKYNTSYACIHFTNFRYT